MLCTVRGQRFTRRAICRGLAAAFFNAQHALVSHAHHVALSVLDAENDRLAPLCAAGWAFIATSGSTTRTFDHADHSVLRMRRAENGAPTGQAEGWGFVAVRHKASLLADHVHHPVLPVGGAEFRTSGALRAEARVLGTAFFRTPFAHHIYHTLLRMLGAICWSLGAFDPMVRLLVTVLFGALPTGHLDHTIQLVGRAVLGILAARRAVRWIFLAAFISAHFDSVGQHFTTVVGRILSPCQQVTGRR